MTKARAVSGALVWLCGTTALLSGCSHSDPSADAAASGTKQQPTMTPQQQMQQIQAAPDQPDALKKVRMNNVSGPPPARH